MTVWGYSGEKCGGVPHTLQGRKLQLILGGWRNSREEVTRTFVFGQCSLSRLGDDGGSFVAPALRLPVVLLR